MTRSFEMWSDRIADADSEESRRALLQETARFRAVHLSDVAAMRRATFTISRLHLLLGDRDRAVQEARQLVSLCQTTPPPPSEEIAAATGWLRSLGEPVPRMQPVRSARPERVPRERNRPTRGREAAPVRPTRGAPISEPPASALVEARAAAARGAWDDAMRAVGSMKGASAALLRAYVGLASAMDAPDRDERLQALRADLARAAGLKPPRAEAPAPPPTDDPLSRLLGHAVPHKRAARIRALETAADAHPERVDALAAAALRHHVESFGIEVPAPWLVGIVGRALAAGEAPDTRAAIAELRAQGALVVSAYDEWPFERMLRIHRRAGATGRDPGGLRRGILARGEPDDRKLWTLRVASGGVERMLAVGPHAIDPYEPGKAEELAARLASLCPRTVLLATGSGNAELLAAAAAAGVTVLEHDADDDTVLAALEAAGPPAAAPAAPQAVPPDRLADLLLAEPLDADAVQAAVAGFRRPDRALRVVQKLALDDARTAALLRAVHLACTDERPVPEGTTLAIRAAVDGPQTLALLTGEGRERFGGPGVEVVVELARALADQGWTVHRVLRGPTRRECTTHPALETLAPALGGLWRLLIRRGEIRGEVWYLADLSPEARAGVPLLLLEPWQRVIVLPIEPDLLAWYGTTGGPEAVGWTGQEGPALLAAVEAFQPTAAEAPAED